MVGSQSYLSVLDELNASVLDKYAKIMESQSLKDQAELVKQHLKTISLALDKNDMQESLEALRKDYHLQMQEIMKSLKKDNKVAKEMTQNAIQQLDKMSNIANLLKKHKSQIDDMTKESGNLVKLLGDFLNPNQVSGMEQSTSPSNTFVNSGNQPSALDKLEEQKHSPSNNDGIIIISDYF